MTISELVNKLRDVMAQEGDIDVVSGLDRTGYGEEVINLQVVEGDSFNPETGEMDGGPLKVVDLQMDDISIVQDLSLKNPNRIR